MSSPSNQLISDLNTSISQGKLSRDLVDNFASKEGSNSARISDQTRGNLASFQGKDKVVYDILNALGEQVNNLNPRNFKPSFFDKLFGRGQNSMAKYFSRFKEGRLVLDDLLKSLEESKQGLLNDNVALEMEVSKNSELAQALSERLRVASEANDYLEAKLQQVVNAPEQLEAPEGAQSQNQDEEVIVAEVTKDPININTENIEEIRNQILFPLKQKILDLQQLVLVHKQGAVALRTLISNNKELANSVERTKSLTLNALNVAIIVAQGLDQQKRVLSAVQDINKQTGDLIAHTSQNLRDQGRQIQEGASNAMLDMEQLKKSFDDVIGAMEDMKNFKLESLPKMQENIRQYQQYLDEIAKHDKPL